MFKKSKIKCKKFLMSCETGKHRKKDHRTEHPHLHPITHQVDPRSFACYHSRGQVNTYAFVLQLMDRTNTVSGKYHTLTSLTVCPWNNNYNTSQSRPDEWLQLWNVYSLFQQRRSIFESGHSFWCNGGKLKWTCPVGLQSPSFSALLPLVCLQDLVTSFKIKGLHTLCFPVLKLFFLFVLGFFDVQINLREKVLIMYNYNSLSFKIC